MHLTVPHDHTRIHAEAALAYLQNDSEQACCLEVCVCVYMCVCVCVSVCVCVFSSHKRIMGESSKNHSPPALVVFFVCFFSGESVDQLVRTNGTLSGPG